MATTKSVPLTGRPVEKSYSSPVQINKTKFFYTNGKINPQINTPSDLVAFSADDQASGREAICVIENISSGSIEPLRLAWDLDPGFFIGHANNPNPQDFWAIHSTEYGTRSEYRHLIGVFEYHGVRGQKGLDSSPNYIPRHCIEEPPYPVQSNTRISYYRVRRGLCKSNNRDIDDILNLLV